MVRADPGGKPRRSSLGRLRADNSLRSTAPARGRASTEPVHAEPDELGIKVIRRRTSSGISTFSIGPAAIGTVGPEPIPAELAHILEHVIIDSDGLVETVRRYGGWPDTAAGRLPSSRDLAARPGKARLQGQSGAGVPLVARSPMTRDASSAL